MSADCRIVVVGSCMTDMFSYTPRLPKPGETIHGHRFNSGFGGKGANQCIAAARLGASAALVAKVGDDYYGCNYLNNLKDHKVDISNVSKTREASTGIATIAVDDAGENSIIIIAGANLLMSVDDVNNSEELIRNSKLVVCQGEISEVATKRALQLGRQHGVTTMMNAAPATENTDKEILSLTDILCVNETEAEAIAGCPANTVEEAMKCAAKLLSFEVCSVIITLGAEGAIYYSEEQQFHVPSVKVTPVDSTGAGDAFTGALAYYLTYMPQLDMKEKIQRSCEVAAISVQSPGTQSSYPNKEQLPLRLFQ